MIVKSTLFCAWLVAGTLCVAAQTGNTGTTGQPGQIGTAPQPGQGTSMQANQGLMLQRGDKLVGVEVKDSTGARIGKVEDIILKSDGTIAYAVIAGTEGQSLYPVPWHSLRVAPMGMEKAGRPGEPATTAKAGDLSITLAGIDSTRWRNAPHFERNAWPKDSDRSLFTQSDTFFGPGSGARPIEASSDLKVPNSGTYFRASKLANQQIVDASGQPVGRFGTFIYDPTAGRVNYTTIALEDEKAANGRVIAAPWQTFAATRQDEKDRFQFNVAKDRLNGAPQFSTGDDSWKKMSDPKWVNEMYGYYSVRPYWNAQSTTTPPDTKPVNPREPTKPVGRG